MRCLYMLKMYTYNYDADTDVGSVQFEFNMMNVNGRKFAHDTEVDGLSSDIQAAIYSDAYTVIGILANWGDSIQFVVEEEFFATESYAFMDPDGPQPLDSFPSIRG